MSIQGESKRERRPPYFSPIFHDTTISRNRTRAHPSSTQCTLFLVKSLEIKFTRGLIRLRASAKVSETNRKLPNYSVNLWLSEKFLHIFPWLIYPLVFPITHKRVGRSRFYQKRERERWKIALKFLEGYQRGMKRETNSQREI